MNQTFANFRLVFQNTHQLLLKVDKNSGFVLTMILLQCFRMWEDLDNNLYFSCFFAELRKKCRYPGIKSPDKRLLSITFILLWLGNFNWYCAFLLEKPHTLTKNICKKACSNTAWEFTLNSLVLNSLLVFFWTETSFWSLLWTDIIYIRVTRILS